MTATIREILARKPRAEPDDVEEGEPYWDEGEPYCAACRAVVVVDSDRPDWKNGTSVCDSCIGDEHALLVEQVRKTHKELHTRRNEVTSLVMALEVMVLKARAEFEGCGLCGRREEVHGTSGGEWHDFTEGGDVDLHDNVDMAEAVLKAILRDDPEVAKPASSLDEVTPGRMPTIVFHDGTDHDTLALLLGNDHRMVVDVVMADGSTHRGLPVCDGDWLVLHEWEQSTKPQIARLPLDEVRHMVIL